MKRHEISLGNLQQLVKLQGVVKRTSDKKNVFPCLKELAIDICVEYCNALPVEIKD